MNHETAWRVLWCLWFACVMGGPYALGNHGDLQGLMYSGPYGFAAFGVLLGIWVGSTDAARAVCRGERARWLLLGIGLGVTFLLVLLELFATALPTMLNSPVFSGLLLQSGSGAPHAWVVHLSSVGIAVGYYEKELVFVFAALCGVACRAGFSWKVNRGVVSGGPQESGAALANESPSSRRGPSLRAVLAVMAGVGLVLGVTRFSIEIVLPVSVGLFAVFSVTLLWAAVSVNMPLGAMHCLVPFCVGTLIFRAACRFGLFAASMGSGCALAMFIVHVLCLLVALIMAAQWHVANAEMAHGKPADVTEGKADSGLVDESMRQRLIDAGLSHREMEVLEACADGLDSAQAAQRLGMQASTVRTYKSRICKKMGCQTIDQVLADLSRKACDPVAAVKHRTHPDGALSDSAESGISKELAAETCRFVGSVSLSVLLLMPYGRLAYVWDATWVMAYAVAFGLLLAVGLVHVLRKGGLARWVSLRVSTFVLVLFAAGCLLCQSGIGAYQTALSFQQRVGLFCTVAGFACCAVLNMRTSFGILRGTSRGILVGVECAAILVSAASVSLLLWQLSCVVSMLALIVGAVLARSAGRDVDQMPARGGHSHVTAALAYFGAAFIWEETWRATAFDSLQATGLAMLVLLCLASLCVLRRRGVQGSVCCVCIGCAGVLAWTKGLCFGLLVGLVLLEAVRILRRENEAARAASAKNSDGLSGCVAAAVGGYAAVYVANAWGTMRLYEPAGSVGPDGIEALCASFFLLVGIGCFLSSWMGEGEEEGHVLLEVSHARLEGFLVGRGLTQDEVRVVVALSQGCSIAQVSEEMSYSISTVNMMRRRAFAKLGIRTRHHLLRLLWDEFDPKRVA